jgi:hypothetical protein
MNTWLRRGKPITAKGKRWHCACAHIWQKQRWSVGAEILSDFQFEKIIIPVGPIVALPTFGALVLDYCFVAIAEFFVVAMMIKSEPGPA